MMSCGDSSRCMLRFGRRPRRDLKSARPEWTIRVPTHAACVVSLDLVMFRWGYLACAHSDRQHRCRPVLLFQDQTGLTANVSKTDEVVLGIRLGSVNRSARLFRRFGEGRTTSVGSVACVICCLVMKFAWWQGLGGQCRAGSRRRCKAKKRHGPPHVCFVIFVCARLCNSLACRSSALTPLILP